MAEPTGPATRDSGHHFCFLLSGPWFKVQVDPSHWFGNSFLAAFRLGWGLADDVTNEGKMALPGANRRLQTLEVISRFGRSWSCLVPRSSLGSSYG